MTTSFARAIGQLGDPAILRVLAKSILATLVIFAALFALLWIALDSVIEGWIASYADNDYSDTIATALAVIIGVIAGWLLFRIVALAVIQFFADEIVLAVERKHYPDAALTARDLPFSESLRDSLRGVGRALLVNLAVMPIAAILLVTGIGTFLLFWFVNAWLLGRELQDLAWARHREPGQAPKGQTMPVPGPIRFLLGGAVAGLLAVPFINLLAPVVGAATATHLVHSRASRSSDAA
ncbi:hypothetical protein GRI94_18165 [Erythrobacter jejuensis]|uniref:CysZ-like protein n=1 Tax=Parerythrobacter jejuensis TaxID=795812 RepID=A0A845AW48_9SPHN|nr:hypothetical protein [Parerythrobacter jejuensis]MXP33759.1 hypothetical protein [Parerythrobacter jejuensis]